MNQGPGTDLGHVAGTPLPAITDEVMHERLQTARPYTAVLLRATGKLVRPGADPIIWEHGRRNFALREHGVLAIVLPATDDSDWVGLAIFTAPPDDVRAIMDHDPGVAAGIFTYEVHPVRGFPGSCLPRLAAGIHGHGDLAACDAASPRANPCPNLPSPGSRDPAC